MFVAGAGHAQPVRLSDAEIRSRLETIVERTIARPEAVGLSVAVGRGQDVIVEQGAGLADLEFRVPANAKTSFRIGSVTKQFTAAGNMLLVERGKLGLDDDIRKYESDFNTSGRLITVRQLLNHTSGIPNYTAQPTFQKGAPLGLTHKELLAFVDGVPFTFEPGKGWAYSNTGYYLLGMIIEAVDGRSYADFIKQEFSIRLGLSSTRYGTERDIIPNRAQGYDADPASNALVNDGLIHMNTPGAAGALISTAGDLVRWQIALVQGRAVHAKSYQEMIGSTVKTGQGTGQYGFGLTLSGEGDGKRISHGGGINGFNSMLIRLPAQDLHIAVISNSGRLPAAAVADMIVEAVTLAQPPPPPRSTAQAGSAEAVRRLIGELARGEPDYSRMSDEMAMLTRQQLPALQSRFKALGAIQSVTFDGVSLRGDDAYNVKMENGTALFSLRLGDDGKLVSALVGSPPAPTPTEDQRMAAFTANDGDKDGKLNRAEYLKLLAQLGFAERLDAYFAQRDANKDGFVTRAEYAQPIAQ